MAKKRSTQSVKTRNSCLSVVIVSDAHMGWESAEQPSTEVQSRALKAALASRPKVDLVVDTGDAYHSKLGSVELHRAKQNWLETIESTAAHVPLIYVPGNHELLDFRLGDTEEQVCNFGSLEVRPYYGFTVCGIHFVSLPELLDPTWATDETLSWLSQDLVQHAEHTTFILAHNSLHGTTNIGGNPGYRELINSSAVYQLLRKHHNVVGWLHGHNHQFEIVDHGITHVSNGRIGGFEPPWGYEKYGHGRLGAIFLEVSSNEFRISCFDGNNNEFLHEAGNPDLFFAKTLKTSYREYESSSTSFGHGCVLPNQTIKANNHFLGVGNWEFALHPHGATLNGDSELRLKTVDTFSGVEVEKIVAGTISGSAMTWHADRGVILITSSSPDNGSFAMEVPRSTRGFKPPYFSATNGSKFLLSVEYESDADGEVALEAYCLSLKGETLAKMAASKPLRPGGLLTLGLTTPAGIIEGYVSVKLTSRNFCGTIRIDRLSIEYVSPKDGPQEPRLLSVGTELINAKNSNRLNEHDVTSHKLVAAEPHVVWGRKACFWQVRNATAVLRNRSIVVRSIRSLSTPNQRVHLAPIVPLAPLAYVFRVERADRFETRPSMRLGEDLRFISESDESLIWIRHPNHVISCATLDPLSVDGPTSIFLIPKARQAIFAITKQE